MSSVYVMHVRPTVYKPLVAQLPSDPLLMLMCAGFPNELAGEDFYILNKLLKIGSIFINRKSHLLIKDRASDRVPFGTGAATGKITQQLGGGEEFKLYPPEAFEFLKLWLEEARLFIQHGNLDLCMKNIRIKAEDQKLALTAADLKRLDHELHLSSGLQEVFRKSALTSVREHHLHVWFDALKTLRMIHEYEKLLEGRWLYDRALTEAPFLDFKNSSNDTMGILEYFRQTANEHSARCSLS